MKIGIITFHASFNYGSMLQAYAMQKYLQEHGHQVEIINYRSKYQKSIYYKPFDFHSIYSLESSIKRLLLYPSSIGKLNKKWYLFNQFLNKNFCLTKEYNSLEELESANFDYDYVIVGSDQIWNTNAPDAGDAYFGNFINNNITRKIAYAPSFGQYPENIDVEYIRRNLHDFYALSVREEKSKEFLIGNRIAENVSVACDPTLLLKGSDYDMLMTEKPLINGDYMFFYTPVGLPTEYFKIANTIADKFGLKVITERAYYPKDIKSFRHIVNYPEVGPCEFLNLIKNATCICGGSFHLQVFSILFRKNFYCINGDKDSRTNNLLTKLGLTNRVISLSNPDEFASMEIDYNGVIERLEEYKKASVAFLNEYLI